MIFHCLISNGFAVLHQHSLKSKLTYGLAAEPATFLFQSFIGCLIWRIGDGGKVNICQDPWLLRDYTRRPCTPKGNSPLNYVAELINPNTGGWNKELVEETFWEEDVNIILNTPVNINFEDRPAWYANPKGIFSVKSAYHVYVEDEMRRSQGGTASSSAIQTEHDVNWTKIWNLGCPNHLKHFVWRIAHNSLAICTNLRKKGLDVEENCPVCKRVPEDGSHLFLKCKKVAIIWRTLNLEDLRVKFTKLTTATDFINEILNLEDKKKVMVIVLLWHWWTERNSIREEGKFRSTDALCHTILKQTNDYFQAFLKEKEPRQATQSKWHPPGLNELKINIDGALFAKTKTGGWGAVIRDHNGAVIACAAGRLKNVSSPLHAEIKAAIRGGQLAVSKGIRSICFETDSLLLKQGVESTDVDRSAVCFAMAELKEFLKQSFDYCTFLFANRNCNRVAHCLARYGCSLSLDEGMQTDNVIPLVLDLVASDLALSTL